MKYWHGKVEGPLCGIEEDYYFACETYAEASHFMSAMTDEFAYENWDPDNWDCDNFTEDEWVDEFNYWLENITKKEFDEYYED